MNGQVTKSGPLQSKEEIEQAFQLSLDDVYKLGVKYFRSKITLWENFKEPR